ncbi:cutinase family protein [Mycobacterium sp. IEC1808]|uniref:cutinase family protein n=1 Tax=Mycobacterium sp. IEC1808 TaxID=1743230 RepID=UPI000A14F73D|nr:cutinase family protein [Mycobacterium sp. IEC1808]
MKVRKPIQAEWARRLLILVSARQIVRFVGAGAVATCAALLGTPVPSASAQPCSDIEVVFARGTYEPPGVGAVGQAFVDSLRAQAGNRSIGVYGVDYPASGDFPPAGDLQAALPFLSTVMNGIYNARDHVEYTAANCPNTRMVIGGYSQGAVIAGFLTSASVPKEVPAEYMPYVPKPMPPQIANHVAAVALFGKPSDQFLSSYGAPPIRIGPLYAPKTIELCVPGDDICSGVPNPQPGLAHLMYSTNGMTNDAAAFAVSHL